MKKTVIMGLGVSAVLAAAAGARTEWQWHAPVEVAQAGMVRLELPPAVLDTARPDLGDIRVLGPDGVETPYLIERPVQSAGAIREAVGFKVAQSARSTVIEATTGGAGEIEAVALVSPAREFLKAVTIDGRRAGGDWQPVATHEVIFRQAGGAERIAVPIPAGVWESLRCTVDDERAEPVPFTALRVLAVRVLPACADLPVVLGAREEVAGETRLTVDLGARNLNAAEILLEVEDAVFCRSCHLDFPVPTGDSGARPAPVPAATIYRVMGENGTSTKALGIPVRQRIGSRSAVVMIHNGDSPPLNITGAKVRYYPTVLALHAASTVG